MISENELVESVECLKAEALRHWINLGWILPQQDDQSPRFDTADVARVRLICELHYESRIEEESLSVVLSLMDQLYASRRAFSMLAEAVAAQPDDIRRRIAATVDQNQRG